MRKDQRNRFCLAVAVVIQSAVIMFGPPNSLCHAAQSGAVSQTAGVDDTRMGHYRALAQLSYQAFQKGDSATAAKLACILERSWDLDVGEKSKSSPQVWKEIDDAMDAFINPILGYSAKAPDRAQVQAAYNDYLEKLKLGDHW